MISCLDWKSMAKPKRSKKQLIPQKIIDEDLAKSSIVNQDVNEKYEEKPNQPYGDEQTKV